MHRAEGIIIGSCVVWYHFKCIYFHLIICIFISRLSLHSMKYDFLKTLTIQKNKPPSSMCRVKLLWSPWTAVYVARCCSSHTSSSITHPRTSPLPLTLMSCCWHTNPFMLLHSFHLQSSSSTSSSSTSSSSSSSGLLSLSPKHPAPGMHHPCPSVLPVLLTLWNFCCKMTNCQSLKRIKSAKKPNMTNETGVRKWQ